MRTEVGNREGWRERKRGWPRTHGNKERKRGEEEEEKGAREHFSYAAAVQVVMEAGDCEMAR